MRWMGMEEEGPGSLDQGSRGKMGAGCHDMTEVKVCGVELIRV